MHIKRMQFLTTITALVLIFTGCKTAPKNTAHQHSTIDALLAGVYDGSLTLKELSEHGNFGIGTFDRLDGEMMMFDNCIYQIKADGKVYTPDQSLTTPFATVCNFHPEQSLKINSKANFEEIIQQIEKITGNPNLFYAIRIEGHFKSMHTRSVPQQSKPYPTLKTVAENQPEFHMQDIAGTIVGFKCPAYVKGINVPGCHLHFLSCDKNKGGHILDFEMTEGICEIDMLNRYTLTLPSDTDAFAETDLTVDRTKALKAVEQ